MLATNLRATVFYKNINQEIVEDAILRENALVASNGSGVADVQNVAKHERFYRTFPRFLELAAKKSEFPIEVAIRKITSLPAHIYSLSGRGTIKEGNIADLVLLKNSTIEAVLVNGKIAMQAGEFTKELAGKLMTKK